MNKNIKRIVGTLLITVVLGLLVACDNSKGSIIP